MKFPLPANIPVTIPNPDHDAAVLTFANPVLVVSCLYKLAQPAATSYSFSYCTDAALTPNAMARANFFALRLEHRHDSDSDFDFDPYLATVDSVCHAAGSKDEDSDGSSDDHEDNSVELTIAELQPCGAVGTCPDGGFPTFCAAGVALGASESYAPDQWRDGDRCLCSGISFPVPATISVTAGSAGNGEADLRLRNTKTGNLAVCYYKASASGDDTGNNSHGGGDDSHDGGDKHHDGIGSGPVKNCGNSAILSYVFDHCTDGGKAGDARSADYVALHVESGDPADGTTTISLSLGDTSGPRTDLPDDPRIAGTSVTLPAGSNLPDVIPTFVSGPISTFAPAVTSIGPIISLTTDQGEIVVPDSQCVLVTLSYDPTLVPPGTKPVVYQIKGFELIPTPQPQTIVGNTISFCADHLSFYGVFLQNPTEEQAPPPPECVGVEPGIANVALDPGSGIILANPTIWNLFWGAPQLNAQIGSTDVSTFVADLCSSNYFETLQQYGINGCSFSAANTCVDMSRPLPPTEPAQACLGSDPSNLQAGGPADAAEAGLWVTVTDRQPQAGDTADNNLEMWLATQIAACNIPNNGGPLVINIFTPPRVTFVNSFIPGQSFQTCVEALGYHDAIDISGLLFPVFYTVIPACDPCSNLNVTPLETLNTPGADLNHAVSVSIAHETAEVMTNPRTETPEAAWVTPGPTQCSGLEVADRCELGKTFEIAGRLVPTLFSNAGINQNGLSNDDLLCAASLYPPQITASAGVREVTVDWQPVDGASAYSLLYSQCASLDPGCAGGTIAVGTHGISIGNLVEGSRYYFEVFSQEGSTTSWASNVVSAVPHVDNASVVPIISGISPVPESCQLDNEECTFCQTALYNFNVTFLNIGDTIWDGTYFAEFAVDNDSWLSVSGGNKRFVEGPLPSGSIFQATFTAIQNASFHFPPFPGISIQMDHTPGVDGDSGPFGEAFALLSAGVTCP